jgi:hypothetical protein
MKALITDKGDGAQKVRGNYLSELGDWGSLDKEAGHRKDNREHFFSWS